MTKLTKEAYNYFINVDYLHDKITHLNVKLLISALSSSSGGQFSMSISYFLFKLKFGALFVSPSASSGAICFVFKWFSAILFVLAKSLIVLQYKLIMRCSYNFGLIVLMMFENFAKLESAHRLVKFWQNFQTLLVLLVPNCTHNCMITYTNRSQFVSYVEKKQYALKQLGWLPIKERIKYNIANNIAHETMYSKDSL